MGKACGGIFLVLLLGIFLTTGNFSAVTAAEEDPGIGTISVSGSVASSDEASEARATEAQPQVIDEALSGESAPVPQEPAQAKPGAETKGTEIKVDEGIVITVKDPEHLQITVPGEFLKAEEIAPGILKMPRYNVQYKKEDGTEVAYQLDLGALRDVDEKGNALVISEKPQIIWKGTIEKTPNLVSKME